MITIPNWLRLAKTGAELLATLEYAVTAPELFSEEKEIGPPVSAFACPCQRCRVYPCISTEESDKISRTAKIRQLAKMNVYCKTCLLITARSGSLGHTSRNALIIRGFVNELPRQLKSAKGFYEKHIKGYYVEDDHRFLLMMHQHRLKSWLQELLIYQGTDIKGLLQIFPTTGQGRNNMGEVLCRAIHHEARFPMDMLRIRFFPKPYQVFAPHVREKQEILTFEVTEFLRLLEMTAVFRSLLYPDEQKMLYELINLKNIKEEQFYWGRFMGILNQSAKDMLNAWKIRQWHKNRIRLLYELIDYVPYKSS